MTALFAMNFGVPLSIILKTKKYAKGMLHPNYSNQAFESKHTRRYFINACQTRENVNSIQFSFSRKSVFFDSRYIAVSLSVKSPDAIQYIFRLVDLDK